MNTYQLPPITILLENGEHIEIRSVNDLPEMTHKLLEMNASIIEQHISRDASKETELVTTFYDFSYPVTLLYVFFIKKCKSSRVISKETLRTLFEIFPAIQRIGFLGNIENRGNIKEGKEAVYSEKLELAKNVKNALSSLSQETQDALKSLYVDLQNSLMGNQEDLGNTSKHYYNEASGILYRIVHFNDNNERFYKIYYEEPLTSLIEQTG